MLVRDKLSYLFCLLVNDEGEKFYKIGIRKDCFQVKFKFITADWNTKHMNIKNLN